MNLQRYFSTGTVFNNVGRFMKKVMKGNNNNKRKWTTGNSYTQPPVLSTASLTRADTSSNSSRRVSVLNKLFMRYITDLMATGENASEFLGRGIEINRVSVASDFKGVNVFWIAKGTDNDEELEKLLIKNAGILRHELSQLRVMGIVPKIHFVRDRAFAKLMEVDVRLAKADFGEDHIPVDPSYLFKTITSIKQKIPEHLKEKIQTIENEIQEDIYEEPLPPMRNDILGLNQAIIMHKVEQLKKKSQALHRRKDKNDDENTLPSTYNDEPVQFQNQKQQMEAFQRFLAKRQILRAKANRTKDKYSPEYEYFRNQQYENLKDFSLPEDFLESEKDYIEDMEDNYKV